MKLQKMKTTNDKASATWLSVPAMLVAVDEKPSRATKREKRQRAIKYAPEGPPYRHDAGYR